MTRLVVVAAWMTAAAGAVAATQDQTPKPSSEAAPPHPSSPQALVGKWAFDDKDSHEDQRNWRRPVTDETPTLTGARAPWNTGGMNGLGIPGPGVPIGPMAGALQSGTVDNDLRRAMRDLLELAESYDITVADTAVTFKDDLGRSTTFATDGRKERHQTGATEYESQTIWNADGQLMQVLTWKKDVRISTIWLAGDDGKLFVWMKVDKPLLSPPVKDIKREYLRAQ